MRHSPSDLKPVDRHLADILATVRPLAPLELDLERALGAVLAEDVTAPVDLPPFANSAMDGYAVVAADLANAPVTLPVTEDVAAGDAVPRAIGPGLAARIMTGAPLPRGRRRGRAGRVHRRRHHPRGHPQAGRACGAAIRRAGEDVRVETWSCRRARASARPRSACSRAWAAAG